MAQTNITDDDEGKSVVDETGEKIGIVSGVRGDTAYVNPEPGATDQVKTMLGKQDVDSEDFALDAEKIEDVTEDEVRLQQGM